MSQSHPTDVAQRPALSLKRIYLIARRDFMGYVKTWGFWVMALTPIIALGLGFALSLLANRAEPTRYATILDETGLHAEAIIERQVSEGEKNITTALTKVGILVVPQDKRPEFLTVLNTEGADAGIAYLQNQKGFLTRFVKIPQRKLRIVDPPATTLEALGPYLRGETQITVDGEAVPLSGALRIYEENGAVQAEYFSKFIADDELAKLTERYFSRKDANAYLDAAGVNADEFFRLRREAFDVRMFDPTVSAAPSKDGTPDKGKERTMLDKAPYFVAAAIAAFLWFLIFSGAYMLLMSMIEEKINKVMEMLLASTRFVEIFWGKMLGIGILTLTSMIPWLILGGISLFFVLNLGGPELSAAIAGTITPKLIFFSIAFLIFGYLFYGSIYISLGSLAESMQDASTLMTPMAIILTASLLTVPIGLNTPDAGILNIAPWIPFSAPFASIIKLPSDPPLWETLGSLLILIASTGVMVFLSSKIFRHGVLTGSGVAGLKGWMKRKILRQKA